MVWNDALQAFVDEQGTPIMGLGLPVLDQLSGNLRGSTAPPTAAPSAPVAPVPSAPATATTPTYPGWTMPGPAPQAINWSTAYANYPTTPGGVTSFDPVSPRWTPQTVDFSQAQLDFVNKYQSSPGMFLDDYPQYSNPNAPGYSAANDAVWQLRAGMPITSTTAWTEMMGKLGQQSADNRLPTFYNRATMRWEPISNLAYADPQTQANFLASKYGYANSATGLPNYDNITQTLQSAGWNPSQGYGPQTWGNDPNMQYLNDLLAAIAPHNTDQPLPPVVDAPPAAPPPLDVFSQAYVNNTLGGDHFGGVIPQDQQSAALVPSNPWDTLQQAGFGGGALPGQMASTQQAGYGTAPTSSTSPWSGTTASPAVGTAGGTYTWGGDQSGKTGQSFGASPWGSNPWPGVWG